MPKFCTYHSNRVRPWLVAQIGGSVRGTLLGSAQFSPAPIRQLV